MAKAKKFTEAELAEAREYRRLEEYEAVLAEAREALKQLDAWVSQEDERLGCDGSMIYEWNMTTGRQMIEMQKAMAQAEAAFKSADLALPPQD